MIRLTPSRLRDALDKTELRTSDKIVSRTPYGLLYRIMFRVRFRTARVTSRLARSVKDRVRDRLDITE